MRRTSRASGQKMEGVGGRKFFAHEPPVEKLRQQFRSKWVRAKFRISHILEKRKELEAASLRSAVNSY